MAGEAASIPAGWVAFSGIVAPGERVRDYAARAQTVRGTCRAQGCTRKVELDPAHLCREGLGLLSMQAVKALWRCSRIDHCGVDFHNEPPGRPLVLQPFVGLPNVRVRVSCRGEGCKFFRVHPVEAMIAGLAKRGQGSGTTPVDEIGAKLTSACPLCKRTSWAVEVLWTDTSSMGWRVLGERTFD